MSKPLFEETDDSENEIEYKLSTNKEYAKVYNELRKKELVQKLKDRGYNNVSEVEDSDDSDYSDDDDEEINVEFDREFYKTLASLKSKDPSIYDKNTKFFDSPSNDGVRKGSSDGISKSEKSQKVVTLKDFERKVILEHNGKFEDSDEEGQNELLERAESPTVVEDERRLKDEFRQALDVLDSEEEEFGGIFKKRIKSKEDKKQEEEDFAEWLAGKKADIEEQTKEKLEPLKEYWNRRNLPQSERFLRDYILNKGYCNTKSSDIPTYDEIVGDLQPLSDDEKELEKQAEFEEKYNFRFEEPDSEFVKRYPRTIENTVRLDAGKRKEKRIELKKRKKEEKEQKMKELEMLKEIKRKEIAEKIEKLKRVTGNEELGFKDEELEEDFDPEAHDRRMNELFNDNYYEVDEGEEKPECPSDIDELKVEDWDNYDPKNSGFDGNYDYEPHCEDDDFNMDCDYDPEAAKRQHQEELIENTKRRRNRRGRRNRFMEMIQQEKPPFNPEDEKTYGEYIEEYYKLDCEDIIGDLPCRFKYVETTPNDFGLTIEEILLAKNKELNQWASLKKALQIRPEKVEKRDQRLYKLKAKNDALKRKIFKSLYGENSDDDDDDDGAGVGNGGVNDNNEIEKANEKKTSPVIDGNAFITSEETIDPDKKKNKKKRKSKKPLNSVDTSSIAESEVKDTKLYNPFAKQEDVQTKKEDVKDSTAEATSNIKKKKKKNKKKKSSFEVSITPEQGGQTQPKANQSESVTKEITDKTNFEKTKKSNPFAGKVKGKTLKFENKKSNLNSKSRPRFKPIKNRNKAAHSNANKIQISDERLKAYNINPRKFHKQQKFGKKPTQTQN